VALLTLETETHFQDVLLLFAEMAEPATQLLMVDALLNKIERFFKR